MRQGARLRQLHLALPPPHEAPLESEHPVGSGDRGQDDQASQRLHFLPEGRQSHPLTTACRGPIWPGVLRPSAAEVLPSAVTEEFLGIHGHRRCTLNRETYPCERWR